MQLKLTPRQPKTERISKRRESDLHDSIDEGSNIPLAWTPFFQVALIWLILGILGCWFWAENESRFQALIWFGILWGLCLLNLVATAKLFSGVLDLMASGNERRQPKNQLAAAIRTSSWGTIKLACWGLLILVLRAQRPIPTPALLLGIGTLTLVPIIGGIWWHQRVVRHA